MYDVIYIFFQTFFFSLSKWCYKDFLYIYHPHPCLYTHIHSKLMSYSTADILAVIKSTRWTRLESFFGCRKFLCKGFSWDISVKGGLKKIANYTWLNLLGPFVNTLHLGLSTFIKLLPQLEPDETICKFCAEAEIWKVKTGTLYFSSSNKVGQACCTEHPLLSQTLGSYLCPIWIKTQTVRPCASHFLRSKHNGQTDRVGSDRKKR